MKFTVTIDAEDAKELLHAARNGYGDGTLFDLDKPAKYRAADWRKRVNRYFRAVNAIERAMATERVAAELRAKAAQVHKLT